MVAKAGEARGFLIDGYPREKSQGIAFESAIAPVTVSTVPLTTISYKKHKHTNIRVAIIDIACQFNRCYVFVSKLKYLKYFLTNERFDPGDNILRSLPGDSDQEAAGSRGELGPL